MYMSIQSAHRTVSSFEDFQGPRSRAAGTGGLTCPPRVGKKKCLVSPNIESLMGPPQAQKCSAVPDFEDSSEQLRVV